MSAAVWQLLLFVVGITTIKTQDLPTIGFISPDIVTDIGGDAELTCTVVNEQEYPILWMRLGTNGDSFPLSSGDDKLITDKRFSLEHDKNTGTYSLSIRDVRKSDAAKYQCQVVVSLDNMITADVELKVKLPPVIKEDQSSTQRTQSGGSVEMFCEADGFPAPKISWSRADGSLMPSGKPTFTSSRLVIPKVRREDRGVYVCTAENGVGKAQKRQTTLEIEFSPEVRVLRPRIAQALHYETELTCDIVAFPPPAITWKKAGVVLKNGPTYDISHFASDNEKITSALKIRETKKEQYGEYTCEATNRHGSDVQRLELYESRIPICPPLCGDTDLNGSSFHTTPSIYAVVIATSFWFCANQR